MGKSHDKQAALPAVVEPKTPVVKREPSLKDQIKNAKSEAEVQRALAVGKTYLYASQKTRRRWHEAAKAKLAELEKR